MIVSIHQPNYLPSISYFHKVSKSDIFVSYDIAQYTKNSFINRNRVKTPHGWTWITIPVKGPTAKRIMDVEIDNSKNWRKKHWLTLQANYSGCKYFGRYKNFFKEVYDTKWDMLLNINEYILRHLFEIICPHVKFKKASELDISPTLDATDTLIEITKKVGGDTYLSGVGGKDYLDESRFTEIALKYQKFKHPTYPQRFGKFIPNMSVIDLLFNCGDEAIKIQLRNLSAIDG